MNHPTQLAFLGFFLLMMIPLACTKTYYLGPLATTPTPVFTPTSTCPGRLVTTLAGQTGVNGAKNAVGTAASFYVPAGVASDTAGNVYIADAGNNMIREISATGVVTTFAGTGTAGSNNGPSNTATFRDPVDVAVDTSGNVYVADNGNGLIRVITPAGVVSTLAGGGTGTGTNGIGTAASFTNPYGVAVDTAGNVYVADAGDNMIRLIVSGGVVSTFAGQLTPGSANGVGTAASFNFPDGIAVDTLGNVYVADADNQLIREITPGGVVSTLAGSGVSGSSNGTGTAASFYFPHALAVDTSGNLYVADTSNYMIREITPGGVVSTLAGSGAVGAVNTNGLCASFNLPWGVGVDQTGNVYVADTFNDLIRKIAP